MLIASLTSQRCVDALSRQSCPVFTGRCHVKQQCIRLGLPRFGTGPAYPLSLRMYSTKSKFASKEAAPVQSTSKTLDAVKASTNNPSKSTGSVSAVKATLRAGHHKSSASSRDAAQKKFEEDPEYFANYMASMSRQAVGLDIWSRAAQTLGGSFLDTFL